MAMKYVLRMMSQNKKRTAFVMVGLIISISLISGMFIATNELSTDLSLAKYEHGFRRL